MTTINNHRKASLVRFFLLTASLSVFTVIVLGGMLRVSVPGSGCPDWPTCYGTFSPPIGQSVLIDYLHRLTTLVSAFLTLVAVVFTLRWARGMRLIQQTAIAAIVLIITQIGLGAVMSNQGGAWLSILHLGLSMLTLSALVFATVVAFYRYAQIRKLTNEQGIGFSLDSPYARQVVAVIVTYALLVISGAVVVASGAGAACPSWPLCSLSSDQPGISIAINLVHRSFVLITFSTLLYTMLKAWKNYRTHATILIPVTISAVLIFSQALLGSMMVAETSASLFVIHSVTSIAVWGALVVLFAFVGLTTHEATAGQHSFEVRRSTTTLAKDLLLLTKPIVVMLLLVTTYAGMVIGGGALPGAALTFWTLVGGFMAAGGSGAINQYIDRRDDLKMQRTQKRPIPSGRLTPAEGLAFGVALALASFYIMVAFVNLLAALLTLAGIFYYVLLYSIVLKKATVQNIVIGGGAGAIPPLVGWAAATGSLNVPSLFLFAVIFMWTPPHFWALALVRRKDYARAGVPMLPVIKGETETRWQILVYTIELVILTLVLPLFGLGSVIYFIGAVVLGAWLVLTAWQVWKKAGNKIAWKMYRYSSMYLAFLMVVLMVDALI
jgi:protoheme IX farnesyltransferase